MGSSVPMALKDAFISRGVNCGKGLRRRTVEFDEKRQWRINLFLLFYVSCKSFRLVVVGRVLI